MEPRSSFLCRACSLNTPLPFLVERLFRGTDYCIYVTRTATNRDGVPWVNVTECTGGLPQALNRRGTLNLALVLSEIDDNCDVWEPSGLEEPDCISVDGEGGRRASVSQCIPDEYRTGLFFYHSIGGTGCHD